MEKERCPKCRKQIEKRNNGYYWCNQCGEVVTVKELQKNNPQGYNQHKKKVKVISSLTDLDKYKKLCELRQRQREIKIIVKPLETEYRSIAQKMDSYL